MNCSEHSRIVVSRQMEEQRKGSSRHLLFGIDLGKNMRNAFLARPGGESFGVNGSLKTSWKGLRSRLTG